MSIRTFNSVGSAKVPAGSTPCVDAGYSGVGQLTTYGVTPGEVVQLVFAGKPPYNLTSTVCDRGACWCGADPIRRLEGNAYNWTVSTSVFTQNNGNPNNNITTNQTIFTLGQSRVWSAVQLDGAVAPFDTTFIYSPNFTHIPNFTQPTNTSSAGVARADTGSLSFTGLAVMLLATLGTLEAGV